MFIQSISLNNYNQQKPKSVAFGGKADKITKRFLLTKSEFKKISAIADAYHRVTDYAATLNNHYNTRFKENFPNLRVGERRRGFTFEKFLGREDRCLQVARFNSYPNSDELISFRVADNNNKELVCYRVNKAGEVLVSAEAQTAQNLTLNPFKRGVRIDYPSFISKLTELFENLSIYSDNFINFSRTFKENLNPQNVVKAIERLKTLQKSVGVKVELDAIEQSYDSLNKLLLEGRGNNAIKYKKMYFGQDYECAKGLMFKNIGKNGETYTYYPSKSKDDNRTLKIVVQDKDGKYLNGFIFFSDGKVMKQVNEKYPNTDFRPQNLVEISDLEIEKLGISDMFSRIDDNMNSFREFIENIKSAKLEKKTNVAKLQAEKLERQQQRAELKAQKELEKQQKREAKIAKKEAVQGQKVMKPEPEINVEDKPQPSPVVTQAQKVVKPKEKRDTSINYTLYRAMRRKKAEDNRFFTIPNKINQEIRKNGDVSKIIPVPYTHCDNFLDLNITKLIESIDTLFATPVEMRSPHLIHDVLPNNKVFSGRIRLEASDGAKVTLTRMKVQQYSDSTYYSLCVEKDGGKYFVNFDPDYMRVLESTPYGKVVINGFGQAKNISRQELLNRIPEAVNLPKYFKEIFAVNQDVERVTVKSDLKIKPKEKKPQIDLIRQKEDDFEEALRQNLDFSSDDIL